MYKHSTEHMRDKNNREEWKNNGKMSIRNLFTENRQIFVTLDNEQ